MMKSQVWSVVLLLSSAFIFAGCPITGDTSGKFRHDVLQIQPDDSYVSKLISTPVTTDKSLKKNDDPYLDETYVMKCDTVVCDYGFRVSNLDVLSEVENLFFMVNVNNASKLSIHMVVGQGGLDGTFYTGVGTPILLDGTPWSERRVYPGTYNWYDYGTFPALTSKRFNAFFAGGGPLKFHISAVGKLKTTGQWVTTESDTEITFLTGDQDYIP